MKAKFWNPSDQSADITAELLSYRCPSSNRCVSIPEQSLYIRSPKIQEASAVPLRLAKVPVILTRRKAANVFPQLREVASCITLWHAMAGYVSKLGTPKPPYGLSIACAHPSLKEIQIDRPRTIMNYTRAHHVPHQLAINVDIK